MQTALIIGNAPVDLPPLDFTGFNFVAVFNSCRNPAYYDAATHHFLRANTADCSRYAGQDEWQHHKGRVCVIDCYNYGQEILRLANASARMTRNIASSEHRQIVIDGERIDYTSGKVPSSGWVAMRYFQSFGIKPVLVGFTWEGVACHDWELERQVMRRLADRGEIDIMDDAKPEPVAPFDGVRLGHFVWLSKTNGEKRDIDGRMWFAIMSFMALHSHWKTTLWTNCEFSGQLVEQCEAMGLVVMQDSAIVADGENLVEMVDFVKWSILADHGGLVMDPWDTLTVGNFDDLHDRAIRLKWSHWDTDCKRMGGGWLCVNRPGSDIARLVCQEFLQNPKPKAPTGRLEDYAMSIVRSCADAEHVPTSKEIVFGAGVGVMENNVIPNNTLAPISFRALQLHFYSGNTWAGERHLKKRATLDSYAIPTQWNWAHNIYSIPFAKTIEAAPSDWRKRFVELVTIPIVSDWTMPEHVVVISLAKRQDRRDIILADAEAACVKLSFFDAFPPVKDAKGWTRGPAELSCALSHQAVIRMANACDWPAVLILEDDSVIPCDFTYRLNEIMAGCPSTANILVCGHNRHCKDKPELRPVSATVGIPAIPDIWGLQCYIVRRPAYAGLLAQWEKYRNPIDIDLSNSPQLNPHYALAPIIKQRNAFGDSDIKAIGKPPAQGIN